MTLQAVDYSSGRMSAATAKANGLSIAPITIPLRRPRRAASSRPLATNRRTTLIAAEVSQLAWFSSRCVRSGRSGRPRDRGGAASDAGAARAAGAGRGGRGTCGWSCTAAPARISPSGTGRCWYCCARTCTRPAWTPSGAPRLTPRRNELMRLLAAGHTNSHIARWLGVSEGTVRTHLESIYDKLGVSSRTAAVIRAFRTGLRSNAAPLHGRGSCPALISLARATVVLAARDRWWRPLLPRAASGAQWRP